ncbi:pyridoxal kinase [Maliponia aquimaris]|uniref:pyridoxal kinase n=1 Tax=Maliponia aquimaris TaxID=1673631 RepID=A0A238K550_9RHOB|nr:pyridoxal kinase [Maliponia aquimaris]SMX37989.1 Pyridoxine kinase [Maliponia aquimaris]
MARVLILSSWVAHGHVGLSAAAPALQALGHTVTQLPTVILSNHPGWPHVSGARVPPEQLRGMIEALAVNGWLAAQDTLLTGYLPSAAHVALACDLADRMAGQARIVVDPVLGDAPKGLYLDLAAAEALRTELVPRADVLTPNLWELGWLTGHDVTTEAGAVAAARSLKRPEVLVTSPPFSPDSTGVLRVTNDATQRYIVPRHDGVPHGVGDVFSALIAGGLDVATALGHLSTLIGESLHAPHLRIAESAPLWTLATPIQQET